MPKRATVQPDWLDDMLSVWGRKSDTIRGWYAVNPTLRSGIPSAPASFEPTGYCRVDFRQLEEAIEALEHRHKVLLVMNFKPYLQKEAEAQMKCYGMPRIVWGKWLHEAAAILASRLEQADAA